MKTYIATYDRRPPYKDKWYVTSTEILAKTLKSAEKKAEKIADECYGTKKHCTVALVSYFFGFFLGSFECFR